MRLAHNLPAGAASMTGYSNHRGAPLAILHSHVLRRLGSELDAACRTVGCARMMRVCFQPSTLAASLICHWTPLASAEGGIAVCVLHLRFRRFVAREVAKEKGICCRIEDFALASAPARETPLGEDFPVDCKP